MAALPFILPAALILLGLLGYPLVRGIWLSFTDATIANPGKFVGLDTFRKVVASSIFRVALFNTVLYTVVSIFFKYILGMTLALLLNRVRRFRGLLQGLVLLPWVVPTVLAAIGWWWIFDAQYSVISWGLEQLGIIHQDIDFLGSPWNARWSVISVDIWRGIPFFAIILLAGMKTIPEPLYEAAKIDGAGSWQRFRYVTLPMLKPISTIVIVFSAILTFSDFSLVWTITQGGPANSTQLLATLAYQVAINGGNLAQGAAIALCILPLLVVAAIASYRNVARKNS